MHLFLARSTLASADDKIFVTFEEKKNQNSNFHFHIFGFCVKNLLNGLYSWKRNNFNLPLFQE